MFFPLLETTAKFKFRVENVTVGRNLKFLLFNMPKNHSHAATLKQHRIGLKEKGLKFFPGTVKLFVLGSGCPGVPKSLYLFSDQSSYLFNCGEGTQRLANEHKKKLSKLDHIFVTYPSWANIGGLPGLALTVQDVGLPRITLHGPEGLDEIFAATKRFVVLQHLAVEKAASLPSCDFSDNVLSVKYVKLVAKNGCSQAVSSKNTSAYLSTVIEDDTDYYAHERRLSHSKKSNSPSLKRKDDNEAYNPDLKKRKTFSPGTTSMAFICRLQARPGSLIIEACVERNVPVGPLLGQLKAGKDVTLPDGSLVRSKDVREPDDPGPIFIVIECPTLAFVDSLVNEKEFETYFQNSDNDGAFLVVHLSPPDVMADSRYQSWMKRFASDTRHLIVNESSDCSGSVAIHEIQYQLNLFDKDVFPLLKDSSIPVNSCSTQANGTNEDDCSPMESSISTSNAKDNINGVNLSNNLSLETAVIQKKETNGTEETPVTQGRTLLSVTLRPQRSVTSNSCLILKPNEYISEVHKMPGFSEELNNFHLKAKTLLVDSSEYPKIVFLGTGSSVPNKIRNTSGILLRCSSDKCIILDCGEGTFGQIQRFYGAEESKLILSGLQAIFVSHLHADHHIGLIGLLQARRKVIPPENFKPLYLVAPEQILAWLNLYHNDFEPILDDFNIIFNSSLDHETDLQSPNQVLNSLLDTLNLSEILTTKVVHCPNAFGISLSHNSGWKITYSGDTMPCEGLVRIGMNSDVLIHEATMEDDLENEAKLKMHSTTSQAIEVGQKMEAKFILLTHFSQRYAKLPNLTNYFDNVGVAFDNMQVRLGDLKKLPLMIPAMKLMFAEHCEEMKLKALKRQRKLEKERLAQDKFANEKLTCKN